MTLDYNEKMHLNATFFYDEKAPFFNHISCTFEKNKINFITGKNGVGKSTLLKILKGTVRPNKNLTGEIFLLKEKHDLADGKTHSFLENNVNLIIQHYDLMLAQDFSLLENLQLSRLHKFPFCYDNNFFYQDIINDLGIPLDTKVKFLSGGQRQIIAIIMSLQKESKVLLLDEPTASLDEENAKKVFDFIEKIIKIHDIFVICISHDNDLIDSISNKLMYEISKNSYGERKIMLK